MKLLPIFISSILLLLSSNVFGQPQIDTITQNQLEIKGLITDSLSGTPMIYATVILRKGGKILNGTETDLDGRYSFYVNEFGIYNIEVRYVGYRTKFVSNIALSEGNCSIVEILLSEEGSCHLEEVMIIACEIPLISNHSRFRKTSNKNIRGVRSPNSYTSEKRSQYGLENFNAEEYSYIIENDFINPVDEALSTFSIDVDRASYSNVRRMINENNLPPEDAVRVEEMVNYFQYDYAEPSSDQVFSVEHHLMPCPWNSQNQILHLGIQGKKIEKANLPPSNLVFLIDVSGSMDAPNKLELVKSSLSLLVDNLRAEDQIAMVVYAGSAGLVLESTSGVHKNLIKNAIQDLSAGGSTAGGAGINLAYMIAEKNFKPDGNNRVILATDGDFNIGSSDEGSLIRLIEEKRDKNIFLSVLGFGVGNYKDNKMQKLADFGNGNHSYIDGLGEAKKTLIDEFGSTLYTIAKDVKIQIEFNPEFVGAYKLIGYENRLLDKRDFNNDKKDAGELGAGHSVTVFYEIIPSANNKKGKPKVDLLKYQSISQTENKSEFATFKIRYKKPKSVKSQKLEWVISPSPSREISDDVQFGLCVAEFGLQLRNSTVVIRRDYQDLLEIAKPLVGLVEDGYRSEFINLVEKVIAIQKESED